VPETIVFSRSLYRPDAVEATADAYKDVARILVTLEDHSIVANVEGINPDVAAEFEDAFCNHALNETIVRHRAEIGGSL
jgi:hypothetical protein